MRVARKSNGWYVVDEEGETLDGPFWTMAAAEGAMRVLQKKREGVTE